MYSWMAICALVPPRDQGDHLVLAGTELAQLRLGLRCGRVPGGQQQRILRGGGQAHRGAAPPGCLSPLVAELRPGPGERFLPPPSVVREVDQPVGAQVGGARRPDACRVVQRSPAGQRNPPKSRPSIRPI
jgi:hypothetical protein